MSKKKAPVPKTLVVGANGYLGSSFLTSYRAEHPETLGTHHTKLDSFVELDLRRPHLKDLVRANEYSHAVVSAGIANILRCEQEPEQTAQCNVQGTLLLVEQLCERKIVPILFSTDYVFDGIHGGYEESSPVNPLNEYGRQKAKLEQCLARDFPNEYLLIRLSKVYGTRKGDRTLIDEMVSSLAQKKMIRAAHDQIFSPICVDDVIKTVIELQRQEARGIYHISGSEFLSRLDLANLVADELGISSEWIERIGSLCNNL